MGKNIQLNGKGGQSYKWIPAINLSNDTIHNPIASLTQTTTYMLVVKNGSCQDTDQITITVSEPLKTKINQPDTICDGESVQLIASGGTRYFWQPAIGLSAINISLTQ